MRRMQFRIEREFVHGRSLLEHAKSQKLWFIPDLNRLDELSSCEYALANRSGSPPIDLRFDWIGYACFEDVFSRFFQSRKSIRYFHTIFGGAAISILLTFS